MTDYPRLAAGITARTLATLLRRVPPGGRSWLARQMVRDRRSPSTVAIADFSEKLALAWANAQFDIHINGEVWLLQQLARFAPKILFDVGANIGEWSDGAAETNPQATIHAFEIMDVTYDKLRKRVDKYGGHVIPNKFGLSDSSGEVAVFYRAASDVHTSTFKEAHFGAPAIEAVMPVRTGDAYMSALGIRHIDLLKIDVEGHEWEVLGGFSSALKGGAIDVIQFEYGKCTLLARRYLRDFYERLDGLGYTLGKLFPDGVRFKGFELNDEDIVGPNYVACRLERSDIIGALTYRP